MVEVEFKREEEGSQKFFVKVLWEKLRSNRWRKANISAENTGGGGGHPSSWCASSLAENRSRRRWKPTIYKELNLSKMKMWTKCPISRLPNLGVGLFVAQQVNSDSQIVFRRQNILVCAQNVNEGKKWILSSFLPFKDLMTPALWSMQNNVEKDRDSPPPTIRF